MIAPMTGRELAIRLDAPPFGPLTPAEMDAELALLAAMNRHKRAVADACTGRSSLLVGTADIERGLR